MAGKKNFFFLLKHENIFKPKHNEMLSYLLIIRKLNIKHVFKSIFLGKKT